MANPAPDDSEVIEVVSVANNNVPAATGAEVESFIIGEPEVSEFDLHGSVCYTHRYFKKIAGTDTAVCLACQRFNAKRGARDVKRKDTFSTTGGSTAGCRSHLFSKHKGPLLDKFLLTEEKIEKQRVEAAEKIQIAKKKKESFNQPKLNFNKDGKLSVSFEHDKAMQERWDRAVVLFISETFTSFSAASKMNILLKAIWPSSRSKINVRTDKPIANHVSKESEQVQKEIYSIISSIMEDGGGIAFTSDIWSNRTSDSFMSLTCHMITEDMELVHFTPFVSYMEGKRHTGEAVLLKFTNFMRKLNLDGVDVQRFVVLDNASINKKAVRLAKDYVKGLWCVCHTLALVVTDLFKASANHTRIKRVLQKCQGVAVLIHRSEQNKLTLKNACTILDTPYKLPVLANATRWNSTDENVESNLQLEKPLRHLSDTDTSASELWRSKVLSPLEYNSARGMHKALNPIKKATKIFEAENVPTIHQVIPELFEIHDVLSKLSLEGGVVSEFARILKRSFERRFPDCGSRVQLYAVAHLLDPKNKGCVLEVYGGAYETARKTLLSLCQKFDKTSPPDPGTAQDTEPEGDDTNLSAVEKLRKRRRISGDQGEIRPRSNIPAAELEIQTFEKLQVDPEDAKDLLKWWKAHKNQFPLISRAVRELLCVPASSSASERAFSIGGLICSQRRGSLSPKRIEELANIKLNYFAVNSYVEKNGKPKNTAAAVPEDEDFGLEEVHDLLNDEESESDFDPEYEELDVDGDTEEQGDQ